MIDVEKDSSLKGLSTIVLRSMNNEYKNLTNNEIILDLKNKYPKVIKNLEKIEWFKNKENTKVRKVIYLRKNINKELKEKYVFTIKQCGYRSFCDFSLGIKYDYTKQYKKFSKFIKNNPFYLWKNWLIIMITYALFFGIPVIICRVFKLGKNLTKT